MTKTTNTLIIIGMIMLVAVFITTAISLQSKTDKIMSTYSARREELAARQLQIQDMIVLLNSTIESETKKQETLASQIDITLKELNTTLSQNITTNIAPPTAPKIVITSPTPTRVTRAS